MIRGNIFIIAVSDRERIFIFINSDDVIGIAVYFIFLFLRQMLCSEFLLQFLHTSPGSFRLNIDFLFLFKAIGKSLFVSLARDIIAAAAQSNQSSPVIITINNMDHPLQKFQIGAEFVHIRIRVRPIVLSAGQPCRD